MIRGWGYGRIEFEDVSFAYPGADRFVLDRVRFRAEPGRVLAITGPSGAGKSTVSRLLLRFHDPRHGRILLDGIDLRDLPLDALRPRNNRPAAGEPAVPSHDRGQHPLRQAGR